MEKNANLSPLPGVSQTTNGYSADLQKNSIFIKSCIISLGAPSA